MEINESHIRKSVRSHTPLTYRFYRVTEDDKLFLNSVLTTALNELEKDFVASKTHYIVQELVDNAYRAILKRLYFKKRNLDIDNPKEYAKGMKHFAEECWDEEPERAPELEPLGFHTDVEIGADNEYFILKVMNTGIPNKEETEKICTRLNTVEHIRTIGEAMGTLQDNTESAGLGTAMIIMILRKIANNPSDVKPYVFYVDRKAMRTVAKVNIALNTLPERLAEPLSEKIAQEIKTLPVYPENIMRLEKMISQPSTPLSKVASVIEKDPVLTTELLRVINSAQYFLPQKVKTIQNAVSLVGIRGLRNLVLSFGATRLLEQRYGKQEELWKHASRCAYYAYTIAGDFGQKKLIDDIYIGAILHDIGEIIVRSVNPFLAKKIQAFCTRKGIHGDAAEQLSIGSTHFKIGAHILRKWNFPEEICTTIEFVAQPLIAPEEFKEITAIIYCADQFAMFHENKIRLSTVEPAVFKKYELHSAGALQDYSHKLARLYEK
ncbi:MAG: HDOD domain-containing protein, partial [Chitinivibrionales bacterium]|nr:HDOD domain-containing protein [Chitinivibrionales bacterium]